MLKYDRSLFKFNSRNARAHLIEQSKGVLLDEYNGKIVKEFEADHVYSLRAAWADGFAVMYDRVPTAAQEMMVKFANDPRNLIISGVSSNRSKGARTSYLWLPLNLACLPMRNSIIRAMAKDYGLSLPKRQVLAMEWSDDFVLNRHKHGILMGRVRAMLMNKGLSRFFMPF